MSESIFLEGKKLYSTADVARLLSIDSSTVKRWADSGRLACYRTIGGHRRFSAEQIRNFITQFHLEGIASAGSNQLQELQDGPAEGYTVEKIAV